MTALTRRTAIFSPAAASGYRWASRALRQLRIDLPDQGVKAVVAPPPDLPPRAVIGPRISLRLRRATCLERSLVLQQWFVTNRGIRADVVIAVATSGGFKAHAWIDGVDSGRVLSEYTELTRITPPA